MVVKGTEYYDAKSQRYVDFPITDVLQMMGRAGRPQFNAAGVACILVHEPKKNFYHRFLYQPFPGKIVYIVCISEKTNFKLCFLLLIQC